MSHTGQSYLGLLTLVLHASLASPAGWCPALCSSDPRQPRGGAEPAAEREGDSESTLAGVPAHGPLGAPRVRRAAPPCLCPHLMEGPGHRLPETPRPSQVISQLLWVAHAKTCASCHLLRLRGSFQEPLCTEKRAPRVTRGGPARGHRHTVTMTALRLYGHTQQPQRAWMGRARTQTQSPRQMSGPERHVRGQHHACPLCRPSAGTRCVTPLTQLGRLVPSPKYRGLRGWAGASQMPRGPLTHSTFTEGRLRARAWDRACPVELTVHRNYTPLSGTCV